MFKVDIKEKMIYPGGYKEKIFQLNFWLNDLKLFVFVFAMVKVKTDADADADDIQVGTRRKFGGAYKNERGKTFIVVG